MKKVMTIFGAILFASLILTSCDNSGSFTDLRDGNVYKTVKIGNQVWMAENLHYLPSVVGPETGSETTPYYYVYGYNGTNVSEAKTTDIYSTYGVLYNWAAAVKACPEGWHLPSDEEWEELIEYLGGEDIAGGKLKETGTTHWGNPNTGATNESGFTAFAGGYRDDNGSFFRVGINGYWWSATEYLGNNAEMWCIYYEDINVERELGLPKESGFSVRCVKD